MRVLSCNVERLKAPADPTLLRDSFLARRPTLSRCRNISQVGKGTELFKLLSDAGYIFQSYPPFNKGFCNASRITHTSVVHRFARNIVARNLVELLGRRARFLCQPRNIVHSHPGTSISRPTHALIGKAIIDRCGDINESRPHLLIGDFNTTHRIDEEGGIIPGEPLGCRRSKTLGWQGSYGAPLMGEPTCDLHTGSPKNNRGISVRSKHGFRHCRMTLYKKL